MSADNEFVAGYELGTSASGLDTGCGDSMMRLAMVLTLGSVAAGFIAVLVLKSIEKTATAKTGEAWARAAQLDAQANVIDARTAQIGTVLAGIAPYLLAVVACFAFALIAVAFFIFMDARAKERQALLLAHPPTELYVGERITSYRRVVDGELHRSSEQGVYRRYTDEYPYPDYLSVCPPAVSVRDNAD